MPIRKRNKVLLKNLKILQEVMILTTSGTKLLNPNNNWKNGLNLFYKNLIRAFIWEDQCWKILLRTMNKLKGFLMGVNNE